MLEGSPLATTKAATAEVTEGTVSFRSDGERARWGRLYDEYARYVAWFASRLLVGRDEVEDVVQEVFLIAAANLDRLDDPARTRGWLKTVALRRAGRRLRWRRVRTRFGLLPLEAAEPTLISPHASPEEQAALQQLLGVLQKLPTKLCLAWSLRYLNEENVETVAQLCGCSLATAKRRIAEAQARIKVELGDE
jgi:RNA polymerase sigma-70 factor (ECF subfamily)